MIQKYGIKRYYSTRCLLIFIFFTSFMEKSSYSDKELEITSYQILYDFLGSKNINYTSITLQGAKVDSKHALYLENDNFWDRIAQCEELKQLEVSNCHLKVFPNKILGLKNLIKLDLSVNEIDSIPMSIFQLTSLEDLSLSYNRIRNLEFLNTGKCETTNLKYLNLFNNLISKIPPNLYLYKTLQIISLNSNRITEIPCSIANMDNIMLNIQSLEYKIDSIPCCFNKPYKDFTLLVNLKNKKLPNCFMINKVNSDSCISINFGTINKD